MIDRTGRSHVSSRQKITGKKSKRQDKTNLRHGLLVLEDLDKDVHDSVRVRDHLLPQLDADYLSVRTSRIAPANVHAQVRKGRRGGGKAHQHKTRPAKQPSQRHPLAAVVEALGRSRERERASGTMPNSLSPQTRYQKEHTCHHRFGSQHQTRQVKSVMVGQKEKKKTTKKRG